MRRKELTIAASEPRKDGATQVEVMLPVRQRRPKANPQTQIAPAADLAGPPRIPRITRLMALAIKFQDMVDRGEVRDYADLARLGYRHAGATDADHELAQSGAGYSTGTP